ncbi:DUF5058 family protein [Microbacterium sp. G2-8]|uniref:DUF5058 family protein n=1 Tax=Microbacterium sp. G2-8 TaxID=2842454 RepID=UPI0027E3601A|nr:DUF5058 family protein [Microbacterium sp. G2-8]
MIRPLFSPDSTDIAAIAQSPVLWACAAAIFLVIVAQSVIYLRAIRRTASAAGLSSSQITQSMKTGAVAALGPSLAVVLVGISLIPLFGTPGVLTRIGLIGSAGYEVAAAGLAAGSQGSELGGPTYTQRIFAICLIAMTIGGLVWMLSALILTPIMSRGDAALRRVNPALMTIVPTAALLGAFTTLAMQEPLKSPLHLLTVVTSTAVMGACLLLARRLKRPWLREWGLGLAILVALAVTYTVARATGALA